MSNLDRFKKDLERLSKMGECMTLSLQIESDDCYDPVKDKHKLIDVRKEYQQWYSEALVLINVIIPHREQDFIDYYKKDPKRKLLTYENYSMEDYLIGLEIKDAYEKIIAGSNAAAVCMYMQHQIVEAAILSFDSSIYDIKNVVQAELFDSELHAAKELNKKGFFRAAGALSGVVLEKHLKNICIKHNIKLAKSTTLSGFNDLLRDNQLLELHNWRLIQHLGDLRNLCCHDKVKTPSKNDVEELIKGTDKICKTIF